MRSVIVDTNSFLRLILNDNAGQVKAFEQLIKQAKQKKLVLKVAQIVIFEIDYILDKYYQFGKDTRIEKIKIVIETPYLDLESRNIFSKAILLYSKHNVSFVDSFLKAKALLENAELFTFDKKLIKIIG